MTSQSGASWNTTARPCLLPKTASCATTSPPISGRPRGRQGTDFRAAPALGSSNCGPTAATSLWAALDSAALVALLRASSPTATLRERGPLTQPIPPPTSPTGTPSPWRCAVDCLTLRCTLATAASPESTCKTRVSNRTLTEANSMGLVLRRWRAMLKTHCTSAITTTTNLSLATATPRMPSSPV